MKRQYTKPSVIAINLYAEEGVMLTQSLRSDITKGGGNALSDKREDYKNPIWSNMDDN